MTLAGSLFTGLSIDNATADSVYQGSKPAELRTGAFAETFRRAGATLAAQTLTTAQGNYTAISLGAGTVVTNIVFRAVGAGTTLTNNFAVLASGALAKIAVSADKTSTNPGANAEITYVLSAPYTVQADGLFYVGLVTVGSSLGTWLGVTGNVTTNLLAPAHAFVDSTTTYSNPASTPTTIPQTAGGSGLWAYVS